MLRTLISNVLPLFVLEVEKEVLVGAEIALVDTTTAAKEEAAVKDDMAEIVKL